MLALLERLVTGAGGSYAFCDTDSMAIVANQYGGHVPCPGGPKRDKHGHECVRALSWNDVDRIVARFETLNPYDRALGPGSILELEDENTDPATGERRQLHCYAITAKRYCLYTLDRDREAVLVKWSEHALGGFYLNPLNPEHNDRDWVREAWEWIVRQDALGLTTPEPDWLDRPALTRFTASHPRLLRPFAALNAGRPYSGQIKPANFLLVAHIASAGYPRGADPKRFALIAAYDPDPYAWRELEWRNVHDPASSVYRITHETLITRGGQSLPPGVVGAKAYRDVLNAYRQHPEPKSLGPDGRPCSRRTNGLLTRRPVQALSLTHIGKEANLLDEIQAGLIGDEKEVLSEYVDLRRDPFVLVRRILAELPVARVARDTGLDPSTVKRIRSGHVQPSPHSRAMLTRYAVTYAREHLARVRSEVGRLDDLAACASYLATHAARACPVCGKPPTGPRASYCSRACRDRAYRERSERDARSDDPASVRAAHQASALSSAGTRSAVA